MRIDGLEVEDFRNYQRQSVSFDEGCNVIYGENAQGKTNLLEALVYLSCGRSPRAKSDREMIRFGAPSGRICARVFAREREFLVEASLFQTQRRKLSINRVPAKNGAELSQVYNTVFFCPEDLFLIREGAAARRRFMDTALCQLRPKYAAALAEYNRAYQQKTRILRDWEEHPALLDALPDFNAQLVRFGAVLIRYRRQFILRLGEYAAIHHRECSGGLEALEIEYQTVSSVTDPGGELNAIAAQLQAHMEAHQAAERTSRLCLSGPHKDDFSVRINGQDARQFASQGQTRTAALALKLAEREIYQNAVGAYPILLLDDVLSELDPRRQEFVLNRISGGQVFITCCENDRLSSLLGGKVLHIRGGTIV